jgi:hypothetical protein
MPVTSDTDDFKRTLDGGEPMNPNRIVADAVVTYEIDLRSSGFKTPEGYLFERRKFSIAQTEDGNNHLVLTKQLNAAKNSAYANSPMIINLKLCKVFQTLTPKKD